ncbi:MAG: hypothetical protein MUC35_05310 [Candidatus Margulisbacteria bacterium]|jgi:methylglyoxal synthase|nr:hypothetical protein [Candidatus Margulisiibacteriota bacterium]
MTTIAKPTLAILASPATRKPGGAAYKLVEENLVRLRRYRIITTGGVGRDLFEQGPGHGLDVHPYLPSDQGGLVQIAADIVDKSCQAVVNIADITKVQSVFSWVSNNTIFNQALHHDCEMMINPRSAQLWVEGRTGVVDPAQETLALIAHSEAGNRKPKEEIAALATEYSAEFARFKRIICTGTTAKELSTQVPDLTDQFFGYSSGMTGGDAQIAREIVEGRCQHVIFLINPRWAQPHQQDVFLFNDIARKTNINILFTNQSAWRWAGALRQELA